MKDKCTWIFPWKFHLSSSYNSDLSSRPYIDKQYSVKINDSEMQVCILIQS